MLITFSTPTVPPACLTAPLQAAQAIEASVCTASTWKRPNQVRLTLRLLGDARPASSHAHEAFISELLRQDPGATVKTARAIYRGRADYHTQTGRR